MIKNFEGLDFIVDSPSFMRLVKFPNNIFLFYDNGCWNIQVKSDVIMNHKEFLSRTNAINRLKLALAYAGE